MAIRWKHGLLRFWVVASVLWIASVWWFEIGKAPFSLDDWTPAPPIASSSPSKSTAGKATLWVERSGWLDRNRAAWAFGPPIGTLAFAYIIGWIFMGFRPRKVG